MTISWGDLGATWGSLVWTWSGGPVGVVIPGCPDPPEPETADPFTTLVESPTWGETGIVVFVETFSLPVAFTVAVYDTRAEGDCPPDGTPLSEILVAAPAGVIFTLDGAAERATFYDKAAKRTRGALRYMTPAGSRLVWPTLSGPCRTACVIVDAGGADTDNAEIAVATMLRES